ncbi:MULTISPECIES: GmrSD restriction endonuclease domain-containing protein [Gordonia]|jgi:hypothetical protein|uniref:DUF1524 domain-containing protein n=1 Tax=Gordonia pseudamarae TaxID=2831662 RepID=A0ABX6ICM5_9ACTN|nr:MULTISPECIES: DUF1524 domain-containing protein [Gordonia]QHN33676.1 DUF1524 domain-containing protein [Gordonia pseudamarae]
MPSGMPTAGWFADPAGTGRMRWWDGTAWSDRYADADGLPPFTPPPDPTGSPGAPRRRPRRWLWPAGVGALIVGLLVVVGLVGSPDDDEVDTAAVTASTTAASGGSPSTPSGPSVSDRASTTEPMSTTRMLGREATAALRRLDELDVKGRAPKTGYSRSEFGSGWSDDVDVDGGHNGCDTRNDMLKDLDEVTVKSGTRGCVVLSGTLHDPYTGRDIAFVRGEGTSSAVQIDHVVALSDAWQKGAQRLTVDERRNLANDPVNLQPTDGPTNSRKGDGDAATWLPPNRSYRCTYVARQIEVKAKYRLWVTAAEKLAMQRVLATCGATTTDSTVSRKPTTTDRTTTVPKDSETTTATPRRVLETSTDEVTEAPTTTAAPTTGDGGGSVRYSSCAQVRAAGKAPIHAGDPGYSRTLDRDGDGVACE